MESTARRARFRRNRSLDARLASWIVCVCGASVLAALVAHRTTDSLTLALLTGLLAAAVLGPLAARRFLRPLNEVLQALSDGVGAMRDTDFSLSLAADRDDELGDLLQLYNEVSSTLREERQSIYQRELLLDAIIQASPLALLLTTERGDVIYDNTAARRWFFGGRRVAGENLAVLVGELPTALAEAVDGQREGLVSVDVDGTPEVFHVSHRWFHLNARRHRLLLIERLTQEINRQEVETWKKVIRLVGHELRNSLGPIASLARSGRKLESHPDRDRLHRVLSTIEDRAEHLESFIAGYARFAKLPRPRLEEVSWPDLVDRLQEAEPFVLGGPLPDAPGFFDGTQIEQALINLLRNARESGSPSEEIVLVAGVDDDQSITVRDRGTGMSPAVLQSALLPFYSTKRTGTGLGLPLCREIAEAHGGRIQVANRSRGGLEVTLWLPLRGPSSPGPPRADPTDDSLES